MTIECWEGKIDGTWATLRVRPVETFGPTCAPNVQTVDSGRRFFVLAWRVLKSSCSIVVRNVGKLSTIGPHSQNLRYYSQWVISQHAHTILLKSGEMNVLHEMSGWNDNFFTPLCIFIS